MKTSASLRGCLEDQPVISMASKKCLGRSNCLINVVWTSSTSGGRRRTKLGFVSESDEDVDEQPLFQLIVTALPASSGCAASISARVIAPIEGARFVYDKKPLQKPTFVTIWEDMHGEGGQAIYEPHEQITARIDATIDTLINEFAEAWTHSQGIGHPKYGAP